MLQLPRRPEQMDEAVIVEINLGAQTGGDRYLRTSLNF